MRPEEHTPYHIPEELLPPPKRKLRPPAAILIFLCLFLLGFVLYWILPAKAPENPLAYDPITLEPKPPEGFFKKIGHFVFSKDVTLRGERDDRINILLLGIGGAGHDGPYLSDTMIIASIKPSTNQVAMISIPRDLLVDIPDKGPQKINYANAFGEAKKPLWGAAVATEVVEKTFDIDIDYYLRVDFRAFKDIVDAVDGVTVNVDRSFSDPLYPAENFAYQTVSFARGVQQMNGDTALKYARSRHGSNGEGSDFARSRRQQKMLLALKEKVLSVSTLTNPIRIKGILDALDTHITTNMEFYEVLALIKMAKEFSTDRIITLVLDTNDAGYLEPGVGPDGAFVLLPKSGNFRDINHAVLRIFEDTPGENDDTPTQIKSIAAQPIFKDINIEIQNGTWHAGLAARMKKRLTDASFPVLTIGNTAVRPQPTSAIYVLRETAPTTLVDALKEELHIPIKEKIPEGAIAEKKTDILVILGEDMNDQ